MSLTQNQEGIGFPDRDAPNDGVQRTGRPDMFGPNQDKIGFPNSDQPNPEPSSPFSDEVLDPGQRGYTTVPDVTAPEPRGGVDLISPISTDPEPEQYM